MTTVGLAQIHVIPGRPDKNVATMQRYMAEAYEKQVHVLAFPELCIPGVLLGDVWQDEAFIDDCALWGQKIVSETKKYPGMIVIFGNVVCSKNTQGRSYLHNAAFLAQNGRLWGRNNYVYAYRVKTRMPRSRAFRQEKYYFTSNEDIAYLDRQDLADMLVPIEIQQDEETTLHIGNIIGADAWGAPNNAPDVLDLLKKRTDVDFVVNLAASYFVASKNISRHQNYSQQARRNKLPLVVVNQVGVQNTGKTVYAFDGRSCVYDATGRMTATASAWQEELLVTELPLKKFLPELTSYQDNQVKDLYEAMVYGVRHFTQSVGIKNAVIGLSGGIDSCVSAAVMKEALGADHVLGINMPSQYNSETTKSIAEELAQNLGIHYGVIPIEESVNHTCQQLETAEIRNMSNGEISHLNLSGLAQENIQSRDRGSRILAAAAAAFDGAVVCNGNKTEFCVGYATMYGDATGYLAPLGDLWKFQVYELAAYINSRYSYIPQAAFEIPPSAELSAEQDINQGLGDPIYYPYHDYLFRSWVEQGHDIFDSLQLYIKNNLPQTLGCKTQDISHVCPTVADFIRDAEYWWGKYKGMGVAKRVQAPPIFVVSSKAFGYGISECQNGVYYTQEYQLLKKQLLGEDVE